MPFLFNSDGICQNFAVNGELQKEGPELCFKEANLLPRTRESICLANLFKKAKLLPKSCKQGKALLQE